MRRTRRCKQGFIRRSFTRCFARPATKQNKKKHRPIQIEALERRELLFSDFTNELLPLDASNDGEVTPIDVLVVINDLNKIGPRELETPTEPVVTFVDTNGDNFVSSNDVLIIINAINRDREPPVLSLDLANDTAPDGNNSDLLTFDATIAGTVQDEIGVLNVAAQVDGGTEIPVTFDRDGNFTFDPGLLSDGSDDGEHVVSVVATDAKGQQSDPVNLTFTLDTSSPLATLTLAEESDSGLLGDRLTTLTNVSLAGQTEPGLTVSVETLAETVQADSAGAFLIEGVALQSGVNTFSVSATDLAGNTGVRDQRVVRAESEEAFALVEDVPFAVEVKQSVDLGVVSESRQLRVRLDPVLDRVDQGNPVGDVLNLFLVDAADPSQTLLDGGRAGTPIFSLSETGPTLTPGITSLQGNDLLIKTSSVAGEDGQLLFQLLSGDSDQESLVVINQIESEVLPALPRPAVALVSTPPRVPNSTPLDVSGFSELDLVRLDVKAPQFDSDSGDFKATLRVMNSGPPIGRDLAIVLRDLPTGVSVANSAGTDQGDPVLNLRTVVPRGGLATGARSQAIELTISNPANVRFPLNLDLLSGAPNRAPELAAIQPIESFPGEVLAIQLAATDADSDPLTFALLTDGSPAALPTMRLSADGVLEIRPEPDQIGQFTFRVSVSDGVASAFQEIQLTINADPVTTTRLSGQILDTKLDPIEGITANIGGVSTLTDGEGRFLLEAPVTGFESDTLQIHGEEFSGPEVFPFIAEKLPLLFNGGRDLFEGVNNVIDRPIFLPELDVANGTDIDPQADVTVEQEIAPGEMARVTVAAGTLKDFNGRLSITEVPRELTPAALPPGVFPGTVVTIQPGEMVFEQPAPLTLPNRGGFARGTELDLFSINPVTGQFDRVGVGRVTSNGAAIETISGGIRNSSWHFFISQITQALNQARDALSNSNNQDQLCDDCEKLANKLLNNGGSSQSGSTTSNTGSASSNVSGSPVRNFNSTIKTIGTSEVELHSGRLRESHDLPAYQSLGKARSVSLSYNSGRADVRPIVHFDVVNANGGFLVARAEVRRGALAEQVPGAAAGQFDLRGGEHFWRVPNGTNDVNAALQIDLSERPTGVYEVDIEHGIRNFNGETFIGNANLSTVPVAVVNSVGSFFGAGWDLAGWQQITEEPDGSVILVNGDGTELRFAPPEVATDPFVSPAGDFSTLRKLPDGTYQRTEKDQTVHQFNANHDLETVADRNGNVTTYTFDGQDRLTGMVDPVGLVTSFEYDGERISKITDPASRETVLQHDAAGNLIRIIDADGSVRSFEYDEFHNLVAETTKRGFREEITYGFHGRVLQTLRRDGTVSTFDPAQVDGLFPADATTSPNTAPRLNVTDGTTDSTLVDPNGNVIDSVLDAAGQVRAQVDDVGDQGRVIRNLDNLTVAQVDGRGNATFFDYDDLGNVIRVRESIFEKGEKLLSGERIEADGSVSQVRLADLDGDGDLDAVAAVNVQFNNFPPTVAANRVAVFRNNGDGQLEFERNFGTGGLNPEHLLLEDVNNDTIPDLIVSNERDDNFTIRPGNGDLTFGDRLTLDIEDEPLGFAAGDLNGDQLVDFIVARERNGSATVLLNDTQGGYEASETPIGPGSVDFALADLNGDGLLDYIAGTTTSVRVAFGNGDGTFDGRVNISNNVAQYSAVDSADVNNDGLLDVVAVSAGFFHVFTNVGGGQLQEQLFATGGTANSSHFDVAVADFDRDGFVDVVLPNLGDGSLVVFHNQGFGRFDVSARSTYLAGNRTTSVAVGDLNGDGDLEVVAGNQIGGGSNGGLVVLEGRADGKFLQLRERGLLQTVPEFTETGDVNRDGIPDLVTAVTVPGSVDTFLAIQVGDGNGDFADGVSIPLDFNRPVDMTIGDFNADGRADLATISRSENELLLLLQSSDGTFSDRTTVPLGGFASNVESFDLDGDGDLDLVVRRNDDQLVVLLNDGSGAFPTNSLFAADFGGNGGPDEMQLVDVDNDGHLDVLGFTPPRFFANTNFILLLGDGEGGFSDPTERGMGISSTQGVAGGDLNGDMLTDIVAVGKGLSVRFGTGNGQFSEQEVTVFGNDAVARSAQLIDFDNDGDLDLLTLLDQANVMVVLLNDGTGQFETHGTFVVGGSPNSIAPADFDLDGDFDVAVASDQFRTISILMNQLIHPCPESDCEQAFEYDPVFNQPVRLLDKLGRETIVEVDATNGNTLSVRSVLGSRDDQSAEADDIVRQFTYLSNGLVDTEIDPLGRVTQFEYDAQGRVTSITVAAGTGDAATTTHEYDAAGNLTAEVDENGHRTEFEYDALNRLTVVRNALEDETVFQYDENGSTTSITDVLGNVTQFVLDPLDRRIFETDALGGVTQYEYDGIGNMIRTVDRLGRETQFVYDARDRLVETINAEGDTTESIYDLDDNVIATIDENGNRTQFVIDAKARPTVIVDPLVGISRFVYDPVDNIVASIDELDRRTDILFDDANRAVEMRQPDPDGDGPAERPVFHTVFDQASNVVEEIDALDNTTTFEFDNRDRLVRRIDPDPDGAGPLESPVTGFEHDGTFRVTKTTDPLGRVSTLEFDELYRLVKQTFPDPDGTGPEAAPSTTYVYDAFSNEIARTDALGNTTSFEYDALHRLVKRTDPDPDGGGPLTAPVTSFVYDAEDQVISESDPLARTTEFLYDQLGRQLMNVGPDPDGDGPEQRPVTGFTYDPFGNLLTVTDPLGNVTVQEFDALHRLVKQLDPDPDGDGPDGRPVSMLVYDAADQLIEFTDPLNRKVLYEYDELGRMTAQIEPDPDGDGPEVAPVHTFNYDPIGNLVSVLDPLGNLTVNEYDNLYRQVRMTDPDPDGVGPLTSPITEFEYDSAGQRTLVRDPLQRETAFEFDRLGRVVRVTEPDPDGAGPLSSPVTVHEYDLMDNRTAVTDPLGNTATFDYDDLHRVIRETEHDPDGPGELTSPVTEFQYDVASQLTAVIDPLGRTTSFVIDDLGRIVEMVEPDPDGDGPASNRTVTSTFDLAHNRLSMTDSLGNVTTFEYDNLYRRVRETKPDPDSTGPLQSPVITVAYDLAGQLLSSTDPLDRTTRYEYDDLGRIVEVTEPDPDGNGPDPSPVTLFRYDAVGNLLTQADALGNVTEHAYDNLYRKIQQRDPDPDGAAALLSPVTQFGYDAAGQLLFQVDPLSRTTTFEYDDLGRVTLRTDPDPDDSGPLVSPSDAMTYDAVGNLLSIEDALGNRYEYAFDNLYRQIEIKDPKGDTTRLTFDAIGKTTSLTDAVGNKTVWEYDDLDRMIRETNQSGDSRLFAYDIEGNLIQTTDRNSRVVEMEYDNLFRETQHRWLDDSGVVERTIAYEYDIADQLLTASDASASLTFTYDDLGRTVSTTQQLAGLDPIITLQSRYDSEDNRTQLMAQLDSQSDFVTQFQYDNLYRASVITQGQATSGSFNAVAEKRVEFSYDIASQPDELRRFQDLNGTTLVASTTYGFDLASRLTDLTHAQNAIILANSNWVFDEANRITQLTSLLDGVSVYSHDERDQLTGATHTLQENESYSYDENGNRVDVTSAAGTSVYQTGPDNRLQSDGVFNYEYDAEGNRTRRTIIASSAETDYDWDHRNRLVGVTERDGTGAVVKAVRYEYDPLNRWVKSLVDPDGAGGGEATQHTYIYDGEQIVLQFDGTSANDLSNRYLWGPMVDQILADEQVESTAVAGDILWTLTDNLGTVRDLAHMDENNLTSIVNHRTYDTFGNVVAETDAAINSLFGFTGRPVDEETGMQNNLNRWYDSATGRWMSEDPIRFNAGDANLYRYVNNLALTHTDPDGLIMGPQFDGKGNVVPRSTKGQLTPEQSRFIKAFGDEAVKRTSEIVSNAADSEALPNLDTLENFGTAAVSEANDAVDAVANVIEGDSTTAKVTRGAIKGIGKGGISLFSQLIGFGQDLAEAAFTPLIEMARANSETDPTIRRFLDQQLNEKYFNPLVNTINEIPNLGFEDFKRGGEVTAGAVGKALRSLHSAADRIFFNVFLLARMGCEEQATELLTKKATELGGAAAIAKKLLKKTARKGAKTGTPDGPETSRAKNTERPKNQEKPEPTSKKDSTTDSTTSTTPEPNQPLGRGSTANKDKGTTLPRNLREEMAVKQAIADPASGKQLPLKLNDSRWPASEGWVKMSKKVDSGGREGLVDVHYNMNTVTGQVDDFKIAVRGKGKHLF